MKQEVLHGDCLELMKKMESNSIDAIVTDPPYGLRFMGKKWDYDVPSQKIWEEALRVLKPGGYLLAFAGTRTQHRMAVRIEDAGFEIRDMIAWVYGSGFPKSLNIGKAVDKLLGNEREIIGETTSGKILRANGQNERPYQEGKDRIITDITKGSSEFEGFGTALKPALEPITVARKPLSEKTVAENCLKWGVGGIDIDGSRVPLEDDCRLLKGGTYGSDRTNGSGMFLNNTNGNYSVPSGRFPANLIHDGSEEVVSLFPSKAGAYAPVKKGMNGDSNGIYGDFAQKGDNGATFYGDSGSAARFFYCAKASGSERGKTNSHATVKPIALMEYLVKLVCRENSILLDPFAGSGTTGIACLNTNRQFILMEKEKEYFDIINKRITDHKRIMASFPETTQTKLAL